MTDGPTKDPLALGLGSLAGGVGFGAACLTAAQIVASILRGDHGGRVSAGPKTEGVNDR